MILSYIFNLKIFTILMYYIIITFAVLKKDDYVYRQKIKQQNLIVHFLRDTFMFIS